MMEMRDMSSSLTVTRMIQSHTHRSVHNYIYFSDILSTANGIRSFVRSFISSGAAVD